MIYFVEQNRLEQQRSLISCTFLQFDVHIVFLHYSTAATAVAVLLTVCVHLQTSVVALSSTRFHWFLLVSTGGRVERGSRSRHSPPLLCIDMLLIWYIPEFSS